MKALGNILWVLLGGFVIAFEYLIASILLMITIVGIPFGIPCGIPNSVDCVGRPRTLIDAKALIFMNFRHKKRRPWTSLDVYLVEPGGFESKDTNTQLKSAFQALGLEKLICRISLSRLAV